MKIYNRELTKKEAKIISSTIFGGIFGLTIALFFYDWKLAFVAGAWFFLNMRVYDKGCCWSMIDEIDTRDPIDGLKFMLKAQIWIIPLLAVAVFLILMDYLMIASIYGIFAFVFSVLSQEEG